MIYLAIYTNKVKSYCDIEFFNSVEKIIKHSGIKHGLVIDNSRDNYYKRLQKLTTLPVKNIRVPKQDYQFQHNVIESLKVLRADFLKTDCKYFFILESDVIAPECIAEVLIREFNLSENTGIIGAQYYKGWHKFSNETEKTHHVLSGCAMYRRDLIEKYLFRIDLKENPGAFPDAWICYDSGKDFSFYNIPIICKHLEIFPGNRGLSNLE